MSATTRLRGHVSTLCRAVGPVRFARSLPRGWAMSRSRPVGPGVRDLPAGRIGSGVWLGAAMNLVERRALGSYFRPASPRHSPPHDCSESSVTERCRSAHRYVPPGRRGRPGEARSPPSRRLHIDGLTRTDPPEGGRHPSLLPRFPPEAQSQLTPSAPTRGINLATGCAAVARTIPVLAPDGAASWRDHGQSVATSSAAHISRMRESLRRPHRSTSSPTETDSTESRLTTVRPCTGSSPGSSTTSLASPRMVVVHGATRARRSLGIAASRDNTTTGRRPIPGGSHHHSSPRRGRSVTARPLHGTTQGRPIRRARRGGARRTPRRMPRRSRTRDRGRGVPPAPHR
jgi:hypothetical protein